MLNLKRKVGEYIHIGSDIIVTVTKIQGTSCTLGVTAPTDVKILRGELFEGFSPVIKTPGEESKC